MTLLHRPWSAMWRGKDRIIPVHRAVIAAAALYSHDAVRFSGQAKITGQTCPRKMPRIADHIVDSTSAQTSESCSMERLVTRYVGLGVLQ